MILFCCMTIWNSDAGGLAPLPHSKLGTKKKHILVVISISFPIWCMSFKPQGSFRGQSQDEGLICGLGAVIPFDHKEEMSTPYTFPSTIGNSLVII